MHPQLPVHWKVHSLCTECRSFTKRLILFLLLNHLPRFWLKVRNSFDSKPLDTLAVHGWSHSNVFSLSLENVNSKMAQDDTLHPPKQK